MTLEEMRVVDCADLGWSCGRFYRQERAFIVLLKAHSGQSTNAV